MTLAELGRATLARQLLLRRETITVPRALERLLAIQAQWPKSPFVALHARLEGFERAHLSAAAKSWRVVRGTGFRGTIFLMNAKDYARLRGTIGATLERAVKSVVKDAVPEAERERVVALGRTLFHAKPRTFDDLRDELTKKSKGKANDVIRRQAYLIRLRVPLLQVPTDVPWGWHAACDFALAEDRIDARIEPAEQHEELVLRYLRALGPATVADAQNFTGVTRLKDTFERLRPKLVTFRDEKKRELFDLPDAPRPGADVDAPVRFLPDFDNVVMGHQDRTRFVSDEHKPFIYLKGLVVNRTYLVDGRAAGTWKIDATRKGATLVLEPFAATSKKVKAALEEEGERLVRFHEPEASAHTLRFERPRA